MTDLELITGLLALVAKQDAQLAEHQPATLQTCRDCNATWHGHPHDPCDWCNAALQRQHEAQRQLVLCPTFLDPENHVRYNELTDIDKAVWRRTRGGDDQDPIAWGERLHRAHESGLITEHERDQAAERYKAWATPGAAA